MFKSFNCKDIQAFIFEYLEGELPFIVQWKFKYHVRKCAKCKNYFQLYKTTATAGDFFKDHPLPDEVLTSTLSFLEKNGLVFGAEPEAKA